MFGGRVAEELIFGANNVTTGASNDIERATQISRNMVTKWGLSERLGPLSYGQEDGEVFLGHSVTKHKEVSEETAQIIDNEVRVIVERNYIVARKILTDNLEKLHAMADALLKYETVDKDQIEDIMEGKAPRQPEGWTDKLNPTPNDVPPVPPSDGVVAPTIVPTDVKPTDDPLFDKV